MRTSCGCRPPVDFERAFFFEDNMVDYFWIEYFGEVCLDEGN